MSIADIVAAKAAQNGGAAEKAVAPAATPPTAQQEAAVSSMKYYACDAAGLSFRLGYPTSVHHMFDSQNTMQTSNPEVIAFLDSDFCVRGLARKITQAEYEEAHKNHDMSAFSADEVKELMAAAEALKRGKL